MAQTPDIILTEGERRWQRRLGFVQFTVVVIAAPFMLGDGFAPRLMADLGLRPFLNGGWATLMIVFLPLNVMDDTMFAAVLRSRPLLLSTAAVVLIGLLPLISLGLPRAAEYLCLLTPMAFVLILWLTIPVAGPLPRARDAS